MVPESWPNAASHSEQCLVYNKRSVSVNSHCVATEGPRLLLRKPEDKETWQGSGMGESRRFIVLGKASVWQHWCGYVLCILPLLEDKEQKGRLNGKEALQP